ncbi:MAG: zf-HC2 domain-containing protein [Planctomycetes bacterium]|nr:zf-HC2 domain-containing protein [Planctomycetota bacterium]
MNCAECKESLVAYLEGLLAEDQKHAVTEHLKDCHSCQAEVKQLTNLQERLVSNGKAVAQSDLENGVLNRIIREQNVRLKAAEKATAGLKLRRRIMKNPVTRISVAAAVVVIAAIGIHYTMPPSITFADVIEPILNARTLILDVIVNMDGPDVDENTDPVIHDTIVDKRIRRVVSAQEHIVNIFDTENARMLTLHTEGKVAVYSDIQGHVQDITQNYVTFLLDIITDIQNNPDIEAEKIGEKEIDGQKVVGFLARDLTIWANAETGLPVRIEGQSPQLSIVFKNFQFNIPVEELQPQVSMDVPDGYKLVESQGQEFDMGTPTEQDLVECLRFWAQVMLDGTFPDTVGMTALTKLLPQVEAKLGELNLSEAEGTQKGMSLGKGMLFHMGLKDRHYAGSGVKVGEADKAVFWYLPQGSETYRVIYGDLSVKDVAEGDLPK